MERIDGRPYNYLRKVKITPNYLAHPAGSVLIEMGGTKVVCSVTFEQGVPGWMRAQGVTGGWVTSEYGMLPASTHARNQREATRGKQSGRTMEIQRLIGRSFRSVIDLKALGTNTVYIDCDVIDADGGTRCASITGASVALQLAFRKLVAQKVLHHFPMRENVAAVSVGMKKVCRNTAAGCFVTSLSAPLLNTLFFMGYIVLAFYHTDYVQSLVIAKGATNPLMFVVLLTGVQGAVEAIVCSVAGTAIGSSVLKAMSRMNGHR